MLPPCCAPQCLDSVIHSSHLSFHKVLLVTSDRFTAVRHAMLPPLGTSPTCFTLPTHLCDVGDALHHAVILAAHRNQVRNVRDGRVDEEALVGGQAGVCDRPPVE